MVDAYLSPILRRYVDQVAAELEGVRLMFMQSNGGLTDARRFQGKDSILSGPGRRHRRRGAHSPARGLRPIIGFDMGGTSTDVSHYAGEFERAFETQVAGVRMRAPMMSIHTVAAGGGSILHFDGARYRVGPDSAGANPGPGVLSQRRAAGGHRLQRHAGQDPAGVLPARVRPRRRRSRSMPAVVRERFAGAGERDRAGHRRRAHARSRSPRASSTSPSATWPNAIKQISVQRGHDVTEYTLRCFGGAGGQHACLVADALGMTRVFIHPLAGVLSAYGMGLADITAMREQAVEVKLEATQLAAIAGELDKLACRRARRSARARACRRRVTRDRPRASALRRHRFGADRAIRLDWRRWSQQFEAAYRQRYCFLMPDRAR